MKNKINKLARKWLFNTYEIRFNTMLEDFEYLKKSALETELLIFNSQDVIVEAEKQFVFLDGRMLSDIIRNSIIEKYDPIYSYFSSLEWDGDDHIKELLKYLNLENKKTILNENIFTNYIISCVKQVFNYETNKECIILVSSQSGGKSYFIDWLCPSVLKQGYTFTYGFENNHDKAILNSQFIVEIEPSSYRKFRYKLFRNEILKNKFTSYRKLYTEERIERPRTSSFIASSNDFDQKSRKNFPILRIKSEGINREYSKKIDVDQVWAQALHIVMLNNPSLLNKE